MIRTRACLFYLGWVTSMFGCAHPRVLMTGGSTPPGLVAAGTGEASAAPDVAHITLGVEALHADSQQAGGAVAQRMGLVIAALKQAGIAAEDIQTDNLSMYFERTREPRPEPLVQPGAQGAPEVRKPAVEPEGFYRVSNTVRAKLRDLDRASVVVDAAMAAGANQMHGIQFKLEDPSVLVATAREEAVADAKRNAQQLASLMGVKLGRVLSIHENGQAESMRPMRMANAKMADASMPVERGTLTVQHRVELVYELP